VHCEIRKKGFQLARTAFPRMPEWAASHKAPDAIDVRLLRA